MYVDIYIVLRQSPNWNTLTVEDFLNTEKNLIIEKVEFDNSVQLKNGYDHYIKMPKNNIIEPIKLWDKYFGRRLFEVRAFMKQNTLDNLLSISCTQLLHYEDIIHYKNNVPKGLYIFIDDDDWLMPVLPSILLRMYCKEIDVYIWSYYQFKAEFTSYTFDENLTKIHTNNYCVSSDFINRSDGGISSVLQHGKASQTILKNNIRPQIVILKEYLSIYNRSIASGDVIFKSDESNFLSQVRRYEERLTILQKKNLDLNNFTYDLAVTIKNHCDYFRELFDNSKGIEFYS